MGDLVDSLHIKETIMLRLNESMKDFNLPPDDSGMGAMLKTVIPPLVGAIATSISLTVAEIMNKSLQKMEQFATERRPEPQMLSTVRQLTYENDRLQQYTRRENVRISGIPLKKDETNKDVEEKTLAMLNKTGTVVNAEDLAACHRVGKAKDGSRPVIVRFVSRRKRTDIMKTKKALKGKESCKGIYINDDLTPLRAKLLHYCKSAPEVERTWTLDGRIFCQKKTVPGLTPNDQQRAIVVETTADLHKIGFKTIDWTRLGLSHLAEEQ